MSAIVEDSDQHRRVSNQTKKEYEDRIHMLCLVAPINAARRRWASRQLSRGRVVCVVGEGPPLNREVVDKM